MGAWISSAKARAREHSMRIDEQIVEESRRFRKECKILILGSPESGKSTFMKQVKINHQNGYTSQELSVFRLVIYKNLVDSAKDIILAMKNLGEDCVEDINRRYTEEILEYQIETTDVSFRLSSNILIAIESFWKDPIIATIMDHSFEFYLMDSAPYFFSQLQRIGSENYVPTESDVLRASVKTTAISETKFDVGQLSIHMIDVGGLQSKRKKWIHCFEAVTSIVFCVALSEYNEVLLEDGEQNRMVESLALFEDVVNSPWFRRTSIILFLNKIDVFKAKLAKVPLERYFPEYTGGPDINEAAKYILWRFTQANRARLSVYPQLVQATDSSITRYLFAPIKETILQNALRDSGVLE